jgi:Arc/MetJ-type ribon-helix-helix transcriptional regulator
MTITLSAHQEFLIREAMQTGAYASPLDVVGRALEILHSGEQFQNDESLAKMPNQGHLRRDLTDRPLRFIALHSFLVIYQADTKPVRIVA